MSRRLVEVYIVDPDRDLPVDKCLVYQGERKITDATDSDLFFELDMKTLLESHNQTRAKTLAYDKFTGKEIPLKPVKVSDLRMTVVNIASF